MKSLIRTYIKIHDAPHLSAVMDLLDSMNYQRLDVPLNTGVIRILPSGEYTGTLFKPTQDYTEIFLKDILVARHERIKSKLRQPEELPFIDDEPARFNSDAFSHKHSAAEPPAYFGNAIRPKPRHRVYAVMGE